MELSYAIMEVLKEFSSERKTMTTHPMTLEEIRKRLVIKSGNRNNLSEVKDKDSPTRKMVRKSMDALLKIEASLPDNQKTIKYKEKGTENKTYRTDYYYKSPLSDVQLKYLVDSTLYSNIINTEQTKQLVKNIKGLSGENLASMTLYTSVFGQSRYSQEIDVLENVEILMSAINKRCKVEFSLNVYNIKKELTPYTECKISPHYVTMGNGRYYLIGTYDGSEKIYLFRVDLMTKIEITTEKSVRRESISELRDMNLSEYMYQHPYMISGEVRRMKLRVNKDIFTQIIDWFGIDVVVLLDTETENTIDVIIKACERAMHYWLLQYGEGVQALEMNDVFARRMQMAAKAIYEKYGKL